MLEDKRHISEDDAYALFTLLEGERWVHFCKSAKPHLQMSRKIKASSGRMRKGKILWFEDELLAKRVHGDVCELLKLAGTHRAGDNRAPKYNITHALLIRTVKLCAQKAGIDILQEQDIFRARGLRDSRLLSRL